MQVGVVKGAAVSFLDDHLAGARRNERMRRPTSPVLGQHVTGTTIVLDMHDRHSFSPRTRQQPGDALHDFLAAIRLLGQGEHALLHVHDHQGCRHAAILARETELKRHDQLQAVAGLIRGQRRQWLRPLQEIEPFLIKRGDTGSPLDACCQHAAIPAHDEANDGDTFVARALRVLGVALVPFEMSQQNALPVRQPGR